MSLAPLLDAPAAIQLHAYSAFAAFSLGIVSGHRSTMIGLFVGALVIAGLLTLLPGRIMHAVVFGS